MTPDPEPWMTTLDDPSPYFSKKKTKPIYLILLYLYTPFSIS
jgi:hypothetical protein